MTKLTSKSQARLSKYLLRYTTHPSWNVTRMFRSWSLRKSKRISGPLWPNLTFLSTPRSWRAIRRKVAGKAAKGTNLQVEVSLTTTLNLRGRISPAMNSQSMKVLRSVVAQRWITKFKRHKSKFSRLITTQTNSQSHTNKAKAPKSNIRNNHLLISKRQRKRRSKRMKSLRKLPNPLRKRLRMWLFSK